MSRQTGCMTHHSARIQSTGGLCISQFSHTLACSLDKPNFTVHVQTAVFKQHSGAADIASRSASQEQSTSAAQHNRIVLALLTRPKRQLFVICRSNGAIAHSQNTSKCSISPKQVELSAGNQNKGCQTLQLQHHSNRKQGPPG